MVANRGETGARLVRALRKVGATSVALATPLEAFKSLHCLLADEVATLGPRAYLDVGAVVAGLDIYVVVEIAPAPGNGSRSNEHPVVTEAIYGLDLVALQLDLAAGRPLPFVVVVVVENDVPRGVAVEGRVSTTSSGDAVRAYLEHPEARVDSCCYAGLDLAAPRRGSTRCWQRGCADAVEHLVAAGVDTNRASLSALLTPIADCGPEVLATKKLLEDRRNELRERAAAAAARRPKRHLRYATTTTTTTRRRGAAIRAPRDLGVVEAIVEVGGFVRAGDPVLAATKMEEVLVAPEDGEVKFVVAPGALVARGQKLAIHTTCGGGCNQRRR
ncbi:hypothetical protein CTAYLR_003437 [Chrysophaeum taylorii]|uniref:Biotin carboxylation domain-containing protein n=1 Tax=Chrysophaeum taylorii TaxID=2483200 RepID=A0AAD7U7M6_9STRA|nr:hypothetical protein CTAYLR_003437 [Chrysophaeum taylorii]